MIKRAIRNLARNAIRHTPEEDQVVDSSSRKRHGHKYRTMAPAFWRKTPLIFTRLWQHDDTGGFGAGSIHRATHGNHSTTQSKIKTGRWAAHSFPLHFISSRALPKAGKA